MKLSATRQFAGLLNSHAVQLMQAAQDDWRTTAERLDRGEDPLSYKETAVGHLGTELRPVEPDGAFFKAHDAAVRECAALGQLGAFQQPFSQVKKSYWRAWELARQAFTLSERMNWGTSEFSALTRDIAEIEDLLPALEVTEKKEIAIDPGAATLPSVGQSGNFEALLRDFQVAFSKHGDGELIQVAQEYDGKIAKLPAEFMTADNKLRYGIIQSVGDVVYQKTAGQWVGLAVWSLGSVDKAFEEFLLLARQAGASLTLTNIRRIGLRSRGSPEATWIAFLLYWADTPEHVVVRDGYRIVLNPFAASIHAIERAELGGTPGDFIEIEHSRRGLASHLDAAESVPQIDGPVPKTPPPKPEWNRGMKELRFNGILVKRFRNAAKNQFQVLDSFEELSWPTTIDDPLPGKGANDARERVQDTTKSLNDGMETDSLLRFTTNGNGTGFSWAAVQ